MKLSPKKIMSIAFVCIFMISISMLAGVENNPVNVPTGAVEDNRSVPPTMAESNIDVPDVPNEKTENGPLITDGLFIITEEVPDGAIEYMQENIASISVGLFSPDTMTVGHPYVVKGEGVDLYCFLVYNNEKLVTLYRVFQVENGDYSGILSERQSSQFLDTFSELMNITTSHSPARIVVGEYEDQYAVVDGKILTVFEDYAGNITDDNYLLQKCKMLSDPNDIVVNAAEEIEFKHPES